MALVPLHFDGNTTWRVSHAFLTARDIILNVLVLLSLLPHRQIIFPLPFALFVYPLTTSITNLLLRVVVVLLEFYDTSSTSLLYTFLECAGYITGKSTYLHQYQHGCLPSGDGGYDRQEIGDRLWMSEIGT